MDVNVATNLSASDLRDFLKALDESERVTVTDWEGMFIGNCMSLDNFTPAQRRVTERLVQKYATRIGWN